MAPKATLPGSQLGPTNRERGITLSLGKSTATLKGKPLVLKITGIGDVMRSNTELIDMSKCSNAEEDLSPIYNT
jgi:hypothetical protein